jgi:DNA primase
MDIKDLVEEAGYATKKKASSHGGEYSSPCPFCTEGDDRFLIWPQRANKNGEVQGGRFSCRVCGKYGDAITFLRELHGLSYKEACEKLRIQPKERSGIPVSREKPIPKLAGDPPLLWQEKAKLFIEWCHEQLSENPKTLAELTGRGFTLESISKLKLGFCPKAFFREREDWGLEPQTKEDGKLRKQWLPMGLTIPTFSEGGSLVKVKIRRTDWREGDKFPKYVEISGSKQAPSVYGNTSLACALVLESEFDALLIQQCAADLVFCVALGGSTKQLDQHTDQLLRTTPLILFCPDFDKAGALAWAKWKSAFPNIHKILTPDGKGAGDAFLAGVDLREWIVAEIEEVQRISKRGESKNEY